MVTLQLSLEFVELLKIIETLPEDQNQMSRGRLNVAEVNDTLQANGVTGQPQNRIAGLVYGKSKLKLRQANLSELTLLKKSLSNNSE